jgi:hypothetical protein
MLTLSKIYAVKTNTAPLPEFVKLQIIYEQSAGGEIRDWEFGIRPLV